MKRKTSIYLLLLLPIFAISQKTPQKGTVITEYGATYEVTPDFKTDTQNDLKVVFDIGRTFGDSTKVNSLFNTAARFLNIHVNAQVPVEHLKVAMVIHGAAAYDILNDIQYKTKYGINNPNTTLIKRLSEKGVQVILCGQTAAYRNIDKQDILPEVKIALSAMTALVQLQNEDYRLINF